MFWLRRWPLQGPWKAIVLKSIATIDELQGGNPGKIPPWKNEGWIKPLPMLFKTGGSGIGAPDFGTAIFSFFSTFFPFSQRFAKKPDSFDLYHIGVSKNRGTPKWMVYNGKPSLTWMIWGETHYFWKHPYVFFLFTPIMWLPRKNHLSTNRLFFHREKSFLMRLAPVKSKAPGIVKELNGVRFWGASLLFLGNREEGWILRVYIYTYYMYILYIMYMYIQIKKARILFVALFVCIFLQ